MDWKQEALSYPECNITRVRDFAPENEMKLAIGQYNRAVRNLRNDSADIAIIALRQLASRYPSFAQAVLLYGCCQMAEGNLHAGRDAFGRADLDRFTERFRTRCEEYIVAAQAELDGLPPDEGGSTIPEEEYRIRPTAPLVQRGSSSRRPLRFIGSRSRGQGDGSRRPMGERTARGVREPLTMRFPILKDYRRILVIVAALALIGFLVFGAVQLVARLIGSIEPAPPSDREKLAWLVDRLENQAASGSSDADLWAGLLAEYREQFRSGSTASTTTGTTVDEPDATTAPTSASTTGATTVRPTPTVSPVPSTTPDYSAAMSSASGLLTDAKGRLVSQPIEALRLLNEVSDVLLGVPGDTRTPGVTPSAAEMLAEKDAVIANNSWNLCEAHRVAAEAPWQVRDFATCLPLYEAIYGIDPQYYTGYCAFRLGLCYEQVGAVAKALECYRTVEAIGTASPQYAGAMARIQALT